MPNQHKEKDTPESSIIVGGIFVLLFGSLWIFQWGWFWIFPLFFAGVIPMVNGIRKFLKRKLTKKRRMLERKAFTQKQILKLAKIKSGILTPAIAALETDLSIEEAEEVLQTMAKNGIIEMSVEEDGRIKYRFPDFLPEP